MPTQRITYVLGSAAEYVRLAPVASVVRRRLPWIRQVLVGTDEGRADSPVSLFEDELDVPELSYVLSIGSARDPGHLADALDRLERVIELERPDFVLVAGDGDTALAAMLAAARREVPVAQLEAGVDAVEHTNTTLLTQRIADEVAALRFAPSEEAADRLRVLSRELTVALIMHPELERAIRSCPLCSRVLRVGPLDYVDSLSLVAKATAVLTDSGDVRTQARHFRVQCLTPCGSTDRLATTTDGADVLIGSDPVAIPIDKASLAAARALDSQPALWDGRASERVVDVFERALSSRPALRVVAFGERRSIAQDGASSPVDLRPA